jgi:hypothetical protein
MAVPYIAKSRCGTPRFIDDDLRHPPTMFRKSFLAIGTQANTDELDALETDIPLIQALLEIQAKGECCFCIRLMKKWTSHRPKTKTGRHTGK